MRILLKHNILALLLLATSVIMLFNNAARASEKEYYKLANLSSERLFEKGKDWQTAFPDSAMICYSLIESRYSPDMGNEDKTLCVDALINKWKIYFYSYYDYASGYECLVKAREIEDASSLHIPDIDLQTGILFQVIGEQTGDKSAIATSYSYYINGLKEAIELKDIPTVDILASNLVWQAWCLGKLDEITDLWDAYANTRNLKRKIKWDSVLDYNILLYKGLKYLQDKNYQKSLGAFDSLGNIGPADAIPIRYKVIPMINKTMIMAEQGDYAGAISILETALRMPEVTEMKDVLMEVHDRLSNCYMHTGQLTDALRHENAGLRLRDSLISYQQLSRLEEVKSGRNLRKYQERLAVSEAERKMQKRVTIIIAIFLIVVCGLLVMVYNRNRRLKESNKELYNKNIDILRQSENELAARELLLKESLVKEEAIKESSIKEEEKYRGSMLDQAEKATLLNRVLATMASTDEYLQPGFSIERLSELVEAKSKSVSQVINELRGCNFNTFINEFRIREACRRISDIDKYGRLTLDAISKSVGFRARSSFFTAFKAVTGLTPSEFQKIARSEQK